LSFPYLCRLESGSGHLRSVWPSQGKEGYITWRNYVWPLFALRDWRASLRAGSPRQSTSGVASGSLPTSQPRPASPRRSARGPSAVKSETLRERAGRGSSWPTRATVWLAGTRATDPIRQPRNGSRNTPRPLGRIETSEVAALREKGSSSFAPHLLAAK